MGLGKHIIWPNRITEILEADSEGRQILNRNTAKQYRYEARANVIKAMDEIVWYALTNLKTK